MSTISHIQSSTSGNTHGDDGMTFERSKEWWLRRARREPDCPISAGVAAERDALWECQQLAATGIEQTNDTGPLADIFAAIHRTAASALASSAASDEASS